MDLLYHDELSYLSDDKGWSWNESMERLRISTKKMVELVSVCCGCVFAKSDVVTNNCVWWEVNGKEVTGIKLIVCVRWQVNNSVENNWKGHFGIKKVLGHFFVYRGFNVLVLLIVSYID